MKSEIIETFNKNVKFYSSYLLCIQEMLNTLIIRIKNDNTDIEYRFYDVVEYVQEQAPKVVFNELLISVSNFWKDEFIKQNNELPSDIDINEIKHFIFNIEGIQFNILSGGFVKDLQHTTTYCEQKIIKELVQ